MGRSSHKPKDFRDLDGILIFDKPSGISSNRALQNVRKLFKARKAGHAGSLDPLATGVLPICFGEATKFSTYLLNASKTYRARCRLGQSTTTGDAEGEVIDCKAVDVTQLEIERVLGRFSGEISQIPPMHSALKHQGQRLYQLARQGKQVERQPRKIQIHRLDLIAFENHCLVIDVHCSKGTYIRTLAQDIGEALGCGAFLEQLQRTGVAPFWGESQYSFEHLSEHVEQGMERIDALLLPVSSALRDFPELVVDDSCRLNLQQGKVVQIDFTGQSGIHRLVSKNGCFFGLGEAFSDGSLTSKRLMNTAR